MCHLTDERDRRRSACQTAALDPRSTAAGVTGSEQASYGSRLAAAVQMLDARMNGSSKEA